MPRPTFNIQLPSIKEMMSSKINDLPPRHRSKFTDILAAYDLEVDKSCIAIKDSIDKIIEKQYDIVDKFIELIDEVLRACHTRFWKANRMRTMYVPGSELTYTAIT
jgi:hypothetical protein